MDTWKLRSQLALENKEILAKTINQLDFWHRDQNTPHKNLSYFLFDSITYMLAHNLPLPKGLEKYHYQDLENLTLNLWAKLYQSGNSYLRRSIGRFVSEIFEPIKAISIGKDAPKMSIYSGHDRYIFFNEYISPINVCF